MTHTQALVEGRVIIIAQRKSHGHDVIRYGEYCYETPPEIVSLTGGPPDVLRGIDGAGLTIIFADRWWKGACRENVDVIDVLCDRLKSIGKCTFLQSNW